MSRGPEANFWNTLKQSLPKNSLAFRLENKAGGGVPDLHVLVERLPVWVELKVANSLTVKLSPHQIAWHTVYFARGGLSVFLVKDPRSNQIALYPGSKVLELASMGLRTEALGRVGSGRDAWELLRGVVVGHYAGRVGAVGSGSGLVGVGSGRDQGPGSGALGSGTEDRGSRLGAGAANDAAAPGGGSGAVAPGP
jgi:hypothetical protein